MEQGFEPLITLDTSALFELADKRAPRHVDVSAALRHAGPPLLVPVAIIAEIAYLLSARLGARAVDALLEDFEQRRYVLDCGDRDIARIRDLVRRYADLPLAVADAAVIACAERSRRSVLALDSDFDVVAREGTIDVLPAAS